MSERVAVEPFISGNFGRSVREFVNHVLRPASLRCHH